MGRNQKNKLLLIKHVYNHISCYVKTRFSHNHLMVTIILIKRNIKKKLFPH